jgi:hypothetical protein
LPFNAAQGAAVALLAAMVLRHYSERAIACSSRMAIGIAPSSGAMIISRRFYAQRTADGWY